MAVKRHYIVVSGRVQGVGYRYFTMRAAGQFRLCGWVRNCADGRVELEAQGEEEDLRAFIAELRRGPYLARVEDLDIADRPPIDGDDAFQIRA